MKIPNKRELWQILFNHLSDINFRVFMKLYRRCTRKPSFVLVNDTILVSNNLLHFRYNLLEKIYKIIMKIKEKLERKSCNTILKEKQQKYHQAAITCMSILQMVTSQETLVGLEDVFKTFLEDIFNTSSA